MWCANAVLFSYTHSNLILFVLLIFEFLAVLDVEIESSNAGDNDDHNRHYNFLSHTKGFLENTSCGQAYKEVFVRPKSKHLCWTWMRIYLKAKALFSSCSMISRSPGPLSLMPTRCNTPCIKTRSSSSLGSFSKSSALLATVSSEM